MYSLFLLIPLNIYLCQKVFSDSHHRAHFMPFQQLLEIPIELCPAGTNTACILSAFRGRWGCVCSPHYSQRACPPMHCQLNTFGWQPEPRSSCPLLSSGPPFCFSRCLPLMFCQDLSLISPQTVLPTCLPSHCPILGL